MPVAISQADLFTLLASGETVVLPQAQAARSLSTRFAREQTPNSAESARALAWTEWTGSLWSNLVLDGKEERLLLNRLQEDQLWAEIIDSHAQSQNTARDASSDLAELARSGLRLAAAYQATDRLRANADTPDVRTFAAWADTFRTLCNRRGLLPQALLEQTLARHLRSGALSLDAPLHLVGFEQTTPAQQDLIDAARTSGTPVHEYALKQSSESLPGFAITTPDARQELRCAVAFIAQTARSARPGDVPTFAVISPNPEEHRSELERLFRELLAPELDAVSADLSSTPWHFAAQPPLTSAALVAHAVDLLRWLHRAHPVDRMGQLLLSPYFTFAEPLGERARFEAHTLRSSGILHPDLNLTDFATFVAAPRTERGIRARFPEIQTLSRQIQSRDFLQGTRLHAEWADTTRSLLQTVGWPGPRSLSPAEFAAVQAWEGVLDSLSTLDATGRRLTFHAFLEKLAREAAHASLPSLTADAPVQVLTLAEADATSFDHTLLLDATDTKLPAAERLHPLLPRYLQTSLRMPGTDPARTYVQTRDRLLHLQARSGTLHILAPEIGDSGPLRITRVAAELDLHSGQVHDLVSPSPPPEPVSLVEHSQSDLLPPLPSPAIVGGARVLELQAACGFRAFATFRLGAEEIASRSMGLDFREAGSRLHKAMEMLWLELKDHATLSSLSEKQREETVARAVSTALEPLRRAPNAQAPWTKAFLGILDRRFRHLLQRWLECERNRAPFTTLSREQERTIPIGPLELTVRPDRVDSVEGGLVFIDYKTSYTLSTEDWLGPRPDAPQLPLYALLAEPEELRGLAFARVRRDKDIGWRSLSDRPEVFSSNTRDKPYPLAEELENWRTELASLAQAFADGEADVDPKTYPKTCQYCAHRLLCRLDPADLLDADEEEGDDIVQEDLDA